MITTLINLDPTSIVITRHTKTDDHGTDSWAPTTLAAQTVRVYNVATHNQREYRDEHGEVKEITFSLLCQPTVDIVVGHDSYDTFVFNSRTYRIIRKSHYTEANIPEHVQADCVAV